jgi:hypothetical protein
VKHHCDGLTRLMGQLLSSALQLDVRVSAPNLVLRMVGVHRPDVAGVGASVIAKGANLQNACPRSRRKSEVAADTCPI